MPNPTLSIVAFLLVATFALNHRAVNSASDSSMDRSEIEVTATALADQVFDHIGEMSFDAAGRVTSPAALTPATAFGRAVSWDDATSIEDLHGQTAALRIDGISGKKDFRVSVDVGYVEEIGDLLIPTSSPQFLKQVTLTVEGPNGFTARRSQVFRYLGDH